MPHHQSPIDHRPVAPAAEAGFVLLIALIATVVPLLLLLGASSQAMQSRQSRLEGEIRDERALVAAESGIDAAIYLASTAAGLTSGVPVTRDLGDGMVYTVTPTFLAADNIFQVLAVGSFGGKTRRLVAYLGPQPAIAPLPSAMTLQDPFPGSELHLQGSSGLDGHDTLMDGSAGDPANDVPGAVIVEPFTVAQLTANIPVGDRIHVLGLGATPSLGTTAGATDMAATQLMIQNAANIVLTAASYNNKQFGNGPAGSFNVIYRNGNVDFKGNTQGAGVMFINGNLHTEGRFVFDGIIFVTGDIEMNGNVGSGVHGGMVIGASSPHAYLEGNMVISYSAEAISGATSVLPGKYLAFNGWQEISRQ